MKADMKAEIVEAAIKAVRKLREHGYAVVVFSPKELGGVDPTEVQDSMIQDGDNYIDMNRPEEDPEEESKP